MGVLRLRVRAFRVQASVLRISGPGLGRFQGYKEGPPMKDPESYPPA